MGKQDRFKDEFKCDPVAEVVDQGYPMREVAERLGIRTKQIDLADVFRDVKAHADRPDMLGLQRAFLTDDLAFVPSWSFDAKSGNVNGRHGFSSTHQARQIPCNVLMTKNNTDKGE